MIPFYGALTDRIGRRRVFLWGAVASIVCALAYFPLLQTGSALIIIVTFVLIMNTGHDAMYATEASYFSELFPTRIRYSGISISAQLGGVFAGAFAPLIATALLDVSGIWLVTVVLHRDVRGLRGRGVLLARDVRERLHGAARTQGRAPGPVRARAGRRTRGGVS